MKRYYLAIDIGASSGRHILGSLENGKYVLEEVFRFPNGAAQRGEHLCWDYETLFENIVAGLAKCREIGKIPAAVGIDTWALDYVLLDDQDAVIGDTVAYRDSRTDGMDVLVSRHVSDEELYARAGIQKMAINTIYQLMALKQEHPEQLQAARTLIMVPDYMNYLLTGIKKSEYTNATTTALVNAETKQWDTVLLEKLGYPSGIFLPLSMPGTVVGAFTDEIASRVGYQSKVILPATHDTGSAFLAVPAKDNNAVYISSGTWSLMGVENPVPITNAESRALNFTNEGGYDYRFRYLKNIMGLWIIQSIRHELNDAYSFAELEALARESADFPSVFAANDERFLAPKSMIDAIRGYCRETNQPVPQAVGELIQCAYRSLAECYHNTIKELEKVSGKMYTSINIVGGGSKDGYLNQMTADRTGLPVYAGPSEGTALGNLMALMLTDGVFSSLEDARSAITPSFGIKEYLPR